MVLHIGVSYKTGPQAKKEAQEISDTYYISEDDDSSKNYFIETHLKDGKKNYFNQAGIFKPAENECIIISSNTKSRGINYNPWEDEFNEDVGYINYYGDNKRPDTDPATTRGNKYLLDQFKISHDPNPEVRATAVPIVFFETRKQGERIFHGYGVIKNVKLVTQYTGSGADKAYFSNYLFTFCVFSMKKEQEGFDWSWIEARKQAAKDKNFLSLANALAPKEWKFWIKTGDLEKVRRKVYGRSTSKKEEQLPTPGSADDKILNQIYEYYRKKDNSKAHSGDFEFEGLAKEITRLIIGDACHDGWVTKSSGDGGYDFVLRVDIGTKGISQVRQVVLGQAKCYRRDQRITGEAVDRVVARLKRGWIAAFVTTSFFSDPAQREILEDDYPIMLISGKQVAQTVRKYIYEKNITLQEYLDSLSRDQSFKSPEDILKEE